MNIILPADHDHPLPSDIGAMVGVVAMELDRLVLEMGPSYPPAYPHVVATPPQSSSLPPSFHRQQLLQQAIMMRRMIVIPPL